jgi:hypothetical protein
MYNPQLEDCDEVDGDVRKGVGMINECLLIK